MNAAIIVFPGSNRERDAARALRSVTGRAPLMVWHAETVLPPVDLVVLPGGFSYGDYLRSGAIAARAAIMPAVARHAGRGAPVIGICNGFQILCEAGLLPGALMRNAGLKFTCRDVFLRVERADTLFTRRYRPGETIRLPIAHGEGNYFADRETLDRLEGEGRIAFRYASAAGAVSEEANPNGSQRNIAGILDARGAVLGLMPHPENMIDPAQGGTDGRRLFESMLGQALVV